MDVPAGVQGGVVAGRGRVGREVADQDGEPSDGKPAAPEVREVDAVEALEVSFYGVGALTD